MDSEDVDENTKNQPWLRIETVGAFEFCPNAGLIAYLRENAPEDRHSDRIPNLGYTPSFEFAKLVERAASIKLNIARLMLFGALLFFIMAVLVRNTQLVLASIFLIGSMPIIYQLIREFEEYRQVLKQIREYDATTPRPLPDIGSGIVSIHWWELVKSGFTPILPQTYVDRENGFRGRPWRILVDEASGKKIPVVWDREILEQRFLSIPRYKMQLVLAAMLIEHHEGGQVDWGLLLDSKTLDAKAIPIYSTDKEHALSRLRYWQANIRELEGQRTYQKPPGYVCKFCKLGYPKFPDEETMIGTEVVEPYLYRLVNIVESMESKRDAEDSMDEENDDFDESLLTGCTDAYELIGFRDWLQNSRTRPALRHSECGDAFRKAPLHHYWEERFSEKLKQYRQWVAQREEN